MTPPDLVRRNARLRRRSTTATDSALLASALALAILGATPLRAQLSTDGSQIWQQGVSGVPGVSDGGEEWGRALASGDFDGDGDDDLAIGAPSKTASGHAGAGTVTILYGTSSGISSAGSTTFGISGLAGLTAGDFDHFGWALASGDFDHDGYDDLAIGVPDRDVPLLAGGTAQAGAVVVVYGASSGLDTSTAAYFHQETTGIEGVGEDFDSFGDELAAGDFDDDGYDDLAIGVPGEAVGALDAAGAVNVIYGTAGGLAATGDQIWTLGEIGGNTEEAGDRFGEALAAGDFDGDQIDDLAIGAPGKAILSAASAGLVLQLAGSVSGLVDGLDENSTSQHEIDFGSAEEFDEFGSALAAGDLDGDGIDDLVVGAPREGVNFLMVINLQVGTVQILKGSLGHGASPVSAIGLTRPSLGGGLVDGDLFGLTVAVGNFDGGKGRDLAVGVPYADLPSFDDAGEVRIGYGPNLAVPSGTAGFSQEGAIPGVEEVDDKFGYVLAVGDFDGNGFDDLAVGVPFEDVGALADAGAINVIYSAGLFRDDFEKGSPIRWSANQGYVPPSVSSAAD